MKREEGFFVYGNKIKFKNKEDFEKNAKTAEQAEAEYDTLANIAVLVPKGYICIDADEKASIELIDDINNKLNLNPYQYFTRDNKSHKHYWYKTNEISDELINKGKLNSQSRVFLLNNFDTSNKAATPYDTRGYREDKRNGIVQGKVFIKQTGKELAERPRPKDLMEKIKHTCVVPSMLLVNKKFTYIQPSGNNWHNSAIKLASQLKSNEYSYHVFNDVLSNFAAWYGDNHSESETLHKWDDCEEFVINEDFNRIMEHFNFKRFNKCIYAIINNRWINITEQYDTVQDRALAMNVHLNDAKRKLKIDTDIRWQQLKGTILAKKDINVKQVYRGIVFMNGYINNVEPYEFIETDTIPFTTTQLHIKYKPGYTLNPVIDKLLNSLSENNETKKWAILRALSGALTNENWESFAFFWGPNKIGKTQLFTLVKKLIGWNNTAQIDSDLVFGKNPDTFGLRNVLDKSLIWSDEFVETVDKKTSNLIKSLITSGNTININIKNSNISEILNTHSWFAATNNLPNFHDVDDALKDRIVVYRVGTNDTMTYEDWNRIANLTLPLGLLEWLIQSYRIVKRDNINTRGAKFEIGDSEILWNTIDDNDYIGWWIKENKDRLNGNPMRVIFDMYNADRMYNTSLPKFKSPSSFGKKLKPYFEVTGKRTYVWKEQ